MTALSKNRIADFLKSEPSDALVSISGWVRSKRGNKDVAFIALSDGSTIKTIQVVADLTSFNEELIRQITTGVEHKI